MGILDKEGQLAAAQAITVTAASANQIYLGPVGGLPKASVGDTTRALPFILTINEAFAAAGAATLQIQVRSSLASNMSSPVVHDTSPVFTLADLALAAKLRWYPRIPHDALSYCDMNFIVATGPMTAGKISVDQGTARQTNKP